jgi:hypothetical protein
MHMKAGGRMKKYWNREIRFGSALLGLYGMVLVCSDPEWAVWAGAMAAGVLVTETPPPSSFTPSDLFAGAATLGVLGLCAFLWLVRPFTERWSGWRYVGGRKEGGEHDGRNHPGT